eukprot:scaffold30769_cov71-Phaeocystis_antarctica.AAC.8
MRWRNDATQSSLHARELLLRDEICLVEQQSVCKRNLRYCLVHDALCRLSVEVPLDVLGVHQSDNAIDPRKRLDGVMDKEGLCHRCGIGHPSGLDDDGVKVQLAGLAAARKLLENRNQVALHRTADAAVEHLDDLFVRVELAVLRDEGVVDRDVTELVLDDCYLLAVRGRQDVVEQRRLPTAEEAREHRGRHARVVVVVVGGHSDGRACGTARRAVLSAPRQACCVRAEKLGG